MSSCVVAMIVPRRKFDIRLTLLVLPISLQCFQLSISLRTLEFWVDNLNPDFLYPELSKQTFLFTELMQALSRHLRPAPYPYGLLTLRLLGKLGGKNRRFLREPIDACSEDKILDTQGIPLVLQGKWLPSKSPAEMSDTPGEDQELSSGGFALPLPVARCVETLKLLAATEGAKSVDNKDGATSKIDEEASLSWKDSEKLWSLNVEDIDFSAYCLDVMDETRRSQALATFRVTLSALAAILPDADTVKCTFEVSEIPGEKINEEEMVQGDETESRGLSYNSDQIESRNKEFVNMSLGVMYGCIVESTRDEAMDMLKGFSAYIYQLISGHSDCFNRIDANGSQISDDLAEAKDEEKASVGDQDASEVSPGENLEFQSDYERLGSLKPFGYFHRVGVLRETVDPLLFNKALAQFLAKASPRSTEVGLLVVKQMMSKALGNLSETKPSEVTLSGDTEADSLHRGARIMFENLLSNLCEGCFSQEWNQRDGLQEAICVLVEGLGSAWGLKYESEIMTVAFSAVKSVPRELSTAVVNSFRFFVRVCCGLYGRPSSMKNENALLWDALAITKDKKSKREAEKVKKEAEQAKKEAEATKKGVETTSPAENPKTRIPCSSVVQVLFTEMASSKQIVR